MSQSAELKNDIVRKWFWAFENDTDTFRETLHPDIEWFPIEEDNTPNRGVEAAMRNRNEWLETWSEHQTDVEVIMEEGNTVVVLVHITATGKTSGVDVDVSFYAHFEVRDGRVVYIYDHDDRATALEAAGFSE